LVCKNNLSIDTTRSHVLLDIKDGKGPIENLFINDSTPRPKPTHAQALIKVKAFGLNRMDLLQREGHYPLPPQAPKTMGVEFSGTIEELAGESERGFKKGDAVFGLAYGGAYAEYIAVSTHMLVHKPDELSWEECAGIPEVSAVELDSVEMIVL
jgi:NADPH:quinone reductase-like Zn-dependent oxidoreductase